MSRCTLLSLSAIVACSSGFTVKSGLNPTPGGSTHGSRVAPRGALPLGLAAPTVRQVAAIPALYGLMSVNEYFTHKYYQHAEFNTSPWLQFLARMVCKPLGKPVPRTRGGGHVEHHAETLDDMSLKTDPRWRATKTAKSLDSDVYRGTAFTWQVTQLMIVQMLPTTIPVFKLMGYSLKHTIGALIPAVFVHALVWNALHPNMHSLPDVPLKDGAPSKWLARFRSSWFFRYLYQNHEGHHIVGGRGNYNVACPGTDHLVGTYIKEKDWRPRSKTTYASHHGEDMDIQQQIANHIAREKFGLADAVISISEDSAGDLISVSEDTKDTAKLQAA